MQSSLEVAELLQFGGKTSLQLRLLRDGQSRVSSPITSRISPGKSAPSHWSLSSGLSGEPSAQAEASQPNLYPTLSTAVYVLVFIGLSLMLLAPLMKAYAASGRIVHAQPWLIGVKGLISAEEVTTLLYGGLFGQSPRTFYSASGTPLAKTEKGPFRRGDPGQLKALKSGTNPGEADDLYSLVDTVSATIYYFRAARPPTVCLYTGRESGMGRFVLCSERCMINELHKEMVIRMPWYVSQQMRGCDWVALG